MSGHKSKNQGHTSNQIVDMSAQQLRQDSESYMDESYNNQVRNSASYNSNKSNNQCEDEDPWVTKGEIEVRFQDDESEMDQYNRNLSFPNHINSSDQCDISRQSLSNNLNNNFKNKPSDSRINEDEHK